MTDIHNSTSDLPGSPPDDKPRWMRVYKSHTDVVCEHCGQETIHVPSKSITEDIDSNKWGQFCVFCFKWTTYGCEYIPPVLSETLTAQANTVIQRYNEHGQECFDPANTTDLLNTLIDNEILLGPFVYGKLLPDQGFNEETIDIDISPVAGDSVGDSEDVNIGPARSLFTKGINAVEKHIVALNKRHAAAIEKHVNKIKRLESNIVKLKQEIADLRLSKEERDYLAKLYEWANSAKINITKETDASVLLRRIYRAVSASQASDGTWIMPASKGEPYHIPEELDYCPCVFYSTHRDCGHLTALRLRTQMQYKTAGKRDVVDALLEDLAEDIN